jgi:histidinol-phosphate phosphatase family protein
MRLENKAFHNLVMNKAIFLDRDGVLNKERKDYVKNIHEIELFHNIGNCISKIKKNSFLAIVITNQSAINRGLTSNENVIEIHNFIQNYLKKFNTKIDAFYYCPHRPDENCKCRKPNPGLITHAASDFQIDLSQSWMIGDNQKDFDAGINAGCKSIKLSSPFQLEAILNKIFSN